MKAARELRQARGLEARVVELAELHNKAIAGKASDFSEAYPSGWFARAQTPYISKGRVLRPEAPSSAPSAAGATAPSLPSIMRST